MMKEFSKSHEEFLCYIKIKLKVKIDDKHNVAHAKGSGIMIDKRFVLTAAHNVHPYITAIKKFENLYKKLIDLSYIKQGLINGK